MLNHVLRTGERADSFRVLLQNALTVHATLVTQQQNDEMRRLSEASLDQNDEVKRISARDGTGALHDLRATALALTATATHAAVESGGSEEREIVSHADTCFAGRTDG